MCGDGVVDPGEACDDGDANAEDAACTDLCALNVCGDGFVLAGVEDCDDGVLNSNTYGHACDESCRFGRVCGDGIVQAEAGEECEPGPGDGETLGCEGCRLLAYRGFVTSEAWTGDLGGLAGADAKCRAAAAAAGMGEPDKFRAFLSSADVSANQRFADKIGDDRPYVMPGGIEFAASYTDLVTNGPDDAGIFRTELGASLLGALVATNTTADGNVYSPEESCASWQSTNKDLPARVGLNALSPDDPEWAQWKAEGWWTNAGVWFCDATYFHLYCLE